MHKEEHTTVMTQLEQRVCGPATHHVGHGQALLSLGGSIPNYSSFGLGIVVLYVLNVEPVIKEYCTWRTGMWYVVDGRLSLFLVLPLLSSRPQRCHRGAGGAGEEKKKGREEEPEEEAPVAITNFASELSETSHTLVCGEKQKC